VRGIIARRILANYHLDPAVARKVIPEPFVPKLVDGHAIGGICLIRLESVRPSFLPSAIGLSSENAAHRFAVEWKDGNVIREGVFVPRRDSSSRFNAAIGGLLFPGIHHLADFDTTDTGDRLSVSCSSRDGETRVSVEGGVASALPPCSIFSSVDSASAFFSRGALSYSNTNVEGVYDGLELRVDKWHVDALDTREVESTFFENTTLFPRGSIGFDCALLMRNISHEWHTRQQLHVSRIREPVERAALLKSR